MLWGGGGGTLEALMSERRFYSTGHFPLKQCATEILRGGSGRLSLPFLIAGKSTIQFGFFVTSCINHYIFNKKRERTSVSILFDMFYNFSQFVITFKCFFKHYHFVQHFQAF